MKWEKTYLPALSGGLMYIVVSEFLPEWSHALVAILAASVFLLTYYLLPKKLKVWQRFLISMAGVVIIAGSIRFLCG